MTNFVITAYKKYSQKLFWKIFIIFLFQDLKEKIGVKIQLPRMKYLKELQRMLILFPCYFIIFSYTYVTA